VAADAKAKTYGDPDPALTYQITSGALVNGDSLTGSLTRVAGNTVGTYALAPGTLSAGPNYTMTCVAALLTIHRKSASVTPNPAGKSFGDTDTTPLTTGTLNGFLAQDNVTASYSRTPGEVPSQYTITATLGPAAVLSNYTITYNTASFTIRPTLTLPLTDTGSGP